MNTVFQKAIFPLASRKAPGISPEDAELLRCINEARNEWTETNAIFEHAYEEGLVDYCTYKLKACECRYAYFINLAKEKGLTVS